MDTPKSDHEHASSELNRYIEQTKRIRELSSPRISSFADEDDYRKRMLDNFDRIRSYAKENNRILNRHCFPYVINDESLDDGMTDVLSDFSRKLYDSDTISQTDVVLMYRMAKRFLLEAEATDDDLLRIRALDGIVSSTYHLTYMRFSSAATIRFREEGWSAVETMLGYLERDRFSRLPSPARLHLMRKGSYYLRLFVGVLFDDSSEVPERNSFVLKSLRDMLDRLNDPFYLGQLPEDFKRDLRLRGRSAGTGTCGCH